MSQGSTENTPIVSPMTNCNQEYLYEQPILQVPGPIGPEGPQGESGSAAWISEAPFLVTHGRNEQLPAIETGHTWPVYGDQYSAELSLAPFGSAVTELGSQMQMVGYGAEGKSNDFPVLLKNSRHLQYGLALNGEVRLFEGYIIQLQLIEIGGIKLWREVLKNF
jgi:hypothetical protein